MSGIFTKTTNLTIILFLVALLTGCGAHPNNATVTSRTGSALKEQTEVVAEENAVEIDVPERLYIVENLDMTDETISLYSLEENKQLRYNYNMTTKFLDKYGSNSQWASFTTGTVVTIGELLPSSKALSSVQKSDDVWQYEDISKYKLDIENNLINIDNSDYKITKKTKVYSENQKVLINQIGSNDKITVVGKDKEVISIAITTGHGYVHLTNTSLFDDSLIFIGKQVVTKVKGDEIIEVLEGTYNVTVANNGWGGTGEYTVKRDEITEINLDDLKGAGPSFCLVTFLVTVPDTYVYIDGKLIDVTEPSYIQYGTHKLVVKCDGYTSWNKLLVVNSSSATITLAMESDLDSSSDSDTSTDSSSDTDSIEFNEEAAQQENDTHEQNASGNEQFDFETDYLSTISNLISNLAN